MSRRFVNTDSARMGVTNNVVATSVTSVASAAFGAQTFQIRIAATSAVNYKIGDPAATPTATTSDVLLPQNWVEYVTVTPGQKIAFFNPAATVTVSVVEITQ